jgi:aminopeptidase YwaD
MDYKALENIEIPTIEVQSNEISRLKTLISNGQAKNLTMKATYQPGGTGTGLNVIAIRPGSKPDAPVIIFGGHYDTVVTTVGASDNGSGTVTALELAKVLFQKFPDYELRFINFSGEEIGLVGSSFYASKLTAPDKKRITAYVNLDALGVGERFVAIGTPELVNLAVDTATKNGIRLESFSLNNTGAGSDHESFIKNGIKSVMLARWIDPFLHRPGDEPARVFPEALLLGGGTAILIVQKIIGN